MWFPEPGAASVALQPVKITNRDFLEHFVTRLPTKCGSRIRKAHFQLENIDTNPKHLNPKPLATSFSTAQTSGLQIRPPETRSLGSKGNSQLRILILLNPNYCIFQCFATTSLTSETSRLQFLSTETCVSDPKDVLH
jgi:hypothetical protein